MLRLAEAHPSLEVAGSCSARRGRGRRGARARPPCSGAERARRSSRSFRDGFFPYLGGAVKEFFEELKATSRRSWSSPTSAPTCTRITGCVSELTWNTFRDHLILEYEVPKYDGDLGSPNVFVPLSEARCSARSSSCSTHFPTQRDKHWFTGDLFRARSAAAGHGVELADRSCRGVPVPEARRSSRRMRPIDGVLTVPLRRIPDERGTIFHMLRADDPHFVEFGEIYFTSVYEGVVKGWHKHRDMTLNYACVHGRVKVALYDDRAGLADPRHGAGGLPRPRRALARCHPAGDLDRGQGHGQPVRDRRQLLPRTRTIPSGRRASTPSTTTSRTTGRCGSTDGTWLRWRTLEHGEGRRGAARVRRRALPDLPEHHRRRAARDAAPRRRAHPARDPRGAERDPGLRLDDPARVEHRGRVRRGRARQRVDRLRGPATSTSSTTARPVRDADDARELREH